MESCSTGYVLFGKAARSLIIFTCIFLWWNTDSLSVHTAQWICAQKYVCALGGAQSVISIIRDVCLSSVCHGEYESGFSVTLHCRPVHTLPRGRIYLSNTLLLFWLSLDLWAPVCMQHASAECASKCIGKKNIKQWVDGKTKVCAEEGGGSVRRRAAAAGETLWGRLPCNPTLTVRPALLSEPSLTALNCYLWQTCLSYSTQLEVPLMPGLQCFKEMCVGGWGNVFSLDKQGWTELLTPIGAYVIN